MKPSVEKTLANFTSVPTVGPTTFHDSHVDSTDFMKTCGDVMAETVHIKLFCCVAEVGIGRVVCKGKRSEGETAQALV